MSKLDRLKEERGWLKVLFAVSAAALLLWINHEAYRRIAELENLS
jgi:hypothetical protein